MNLFGAQLLARMMANEEVYGVMGSWSNRDQHHNGHEDVASENDYVTAAWGLWGGIEKQLDTELSFELVI